MNSVFRTARLRHESGSLAIVRANPLAQTLDRLHTSLQGLTEGSVATYIPELGLANPDHFGICVATVDGRVYGVGDCDVPFTIQSVSKPFVYGLALESLGVEEVLRSVGVEPSGDAFNAISLDPVSGRPRNPMINAGAIASAGLIPERDGQAPFDRMLGLLSTLAGRDLEVDESVFRSEHDTGHRNRAIGHLLKNAGILDGDVEDVCDRYFRQCSVLVTCEDLAMMGASLAAGGLNPRTGARALSPDTVQRVLSVMSTCGMYDYAGSWVYRVGLPAKSGVGGGIVAVLPGQLGIGVFSPRLDALGNSVRGVAACEQLSREFGLHLLRPPVAVESVIRRVVFLSDLRSRRQRSEREAQSLEQSGAGVPVIHLQGPLVFSTIEIVLREALTYAGDGTVIFDLGRVTQVDAPVAAIFAEFAQQTEALSGLCVFAGIRESMPGSSLLDTALAARGSPGAVFADLGTALEWCEDRLLAGAGLSRDDHYEMPIALHPLSAALSAEDAEALTAAMERGEAHAGEVIVRRGSRSSSVFLLVSGTVAVSVKNEGGKTHRLATLGPGAVFGELALLDSGPRSADVVAVTDVAYYELPLLAIDSHDGQSPGVRLRVVEVLARDLAARLRRANAQIEALAG